MPNFKIKPLALLALLLISGPTFSQTGLSCSTDRVVFSINGVLTGDGEAHANSDVLRERYIAANAGDSAPPRFKVLYNPSGKKYLRGAGGAVDFVEVIMQQTGLAMSRVIRMAMALQPIPDQYKTTITNILSTVAIMGHTADPATLATMLTATKADIGQGNKVLLVAHSQGNLWANGLVALVTEPKQRAALGQVGIGVPDSRLEKSTVAHITLTEDWVIRPIPFALPANTLNGYNATEILARTLGHNFIKAYMEAGRPAADAILAATKTAFVALTPVPNPSGQGPLTVTQTWGAQSDVDLHVFEPGGAHVYYNTPNGVAGYLDVDDTTSFGPEHYFSSCARILTGEYRVGVNYYAGSGPETATVFIQAGTVSLSRKVALAAARGASGNSSPVPVARVNIQRNPSTGEIEAAIVP